MKMVEVDKILLLLMTGISGGFFQKKKKSSFHLLIHFAQSTIFYKSFLNQILTLRYSILPPKEVLQSKACFKIQEYFRSVTSWRGCWEGATQERLLGLSHLLLGALCENAVLTSGYSLVNGKMCCHMQMEIQPERKCLLIINGHCFLLLLLSYLYQIIFHLLSNYSRTLLSLTKKNIACLITVCDK